MCVGPSSFRRRRKNASIVTGAGNANAQKGLREFNLLFCVPRIKRYGLERQSFMTVGSRH